MVTWLNITQEIVFLKSHTKCGGEVSPRPFHKIWAYLEISSLECLFLMDVEVRVYQNILKLRCYHLLLPYIQLIKKTKRGLGLDSLPHFLHDFWRKMFLMIYFANWLNFIAWLLLLLETLCNMCIFIICCAVVCDAINFEINHSFVIKPFFCISKMSGQKCKNLKNKRRF